MTKILIDAISNISIHNGVLRVECEAVGANGQQNNSGTLVIPGAVAVQVLQSLTGGLQELDRRLREQSSAQSAEQ